MNYSGSTFYINNLIQARHQKFLSAGFLNSQLLIEFNAIITDLGKFGSHDTDFPSQYFSH